MQDATHDRLRATVYWDYGCSVVQGLHTAFCEALRVYYILLSWTDLYPVLNTNRISRDIIGGCRDGDVRLPYSPVIIPSPRLELAQRRCLHSNQGVPRLLAYKARSSHTAESSALPRRTTLRGLRAALTLLSGFQKGDIMMSDISPLLAGLLSSWVVALIYGMNVVLMVLCASKLLRRSRENPRHAVVCLVAFLFCTCTAHVSAFLADAIIGFTRAETPSMHFRAIARPCFVTTIVFYSINAEVGDLFLIWRVYILWRRNKYMIIPFLLAALAFAVTDILAIAMLVHLETPANARVHAWTTSAWAITVTIQTAGTTLIVWRMWSTPSVVTESDGRGSCNPFAILWAIVESGSLYTVMTLATLAFSFSRPITVEILTAILGQISAFVPLTVILRELWKAEHPKPLPRAINPLGLDEYNLNRRHDGGNNVIVAIQRTTQDPRGSLVLKSKYDTEGGSRGY